MDENSRRDEGGMLLLLYQLELCRVMQDIDYQCRRFLGFASFFGGVREGVPALLVGRGGGAGLCIEVSEALTKQDHFVPPSLIPGGISLNKWVPR